MKLASCSAGDRKEPTHGGINGEDKSPGFQDGGVKARALVAPQSTLVSRKAATPIMTTLTVSGEDSPAVRKYTAVAG
jgi:hypothetical protein